MGGVKVQNGLEFFGEKGKSTGNQQHPDAMLAGGAHQCFCPGVEAQFLIKNLLQHINRQAFKKGDTPPETL